MPIEFPREEKSAAFRREDVPQRTSCDWLETIGATFRSVAVWVIAGAVVLCLGMRAMRPALIAAEKLMHANNPYWSDSIMPTVLFALFGLAFGLVLGWRLSRGASLGGPGTWLAAGASIMAFSATGVVAASILFPPAVPSTCWLSLACMAMAAGGGTYLATIWLG